MESDEFEVDNKVIESSHHVRRSRMSETKHCIACAEEILSAAKMCKHCKTMQDDSTFAEPPKPVLIPHECNHETLASWARRDARFMKPSIKPILREHGNELLLASFDTTPKGMKVLSHEMIFTDQHLIFGGYGGFNPRSEVYPLSIFDSIILADRFDDDIHRRIIGFLKEDKFVLDLRTRIIGKGMGRMPIEEFNQKMNVVAGHVPVCESGEVFESHTETFYGVGFIQTWN
jgi:hypothetical protein